MKTFKSANGKWNWKVCRLLTEANETIKKWKIWKMSLRTYHWIEMENPKPVSDLGKREKEKMISFRDLK